MKTAVLRTGGKQYRVSPGDVIRVEKLAGEAGTTIELGEVLLAVEGEQTRVGAPLLEGAKVTARILEQGKARKILVFKKKRRKGYRRKRGHRQQLTTLEVLDVEG